MCHLIKLETGQAVMVCGVRTKPRWCECGREAPFLCDWKILRAGKKATCDRPICANHAQQVAPDKHLCQWHQPLYEQWKKRRVRQRGLFEEAS